MDKSFIGILDDFKDLAEIFFNTGSYREATFVYREAVDLCNKIEDKHTRLLASSELIHRLGTSLAKEQKYSEAEMHFKEAIKRKKEIILQEKGHVFSELRSRLADSINNLAGIFWATGRRLEAMDMLRHVLNTRKEIVFYDDVHCAEALYKVLATWGNLISCCIDGGMMKAALDAGKQAMKDAECDDVELDQMGHFELSKIAKKMATISDDEGDHKKSLKYLKIAVSAEKRANLGVPDEQIAANLFQLGDLYFGFRKYKKALNFFNESATMYHCLSDERYHRVMTEIVGRLAITLQFTGSYTEAFQCRNIYIGMQNNLLALRDTPVKEIGEVNKNYSDDDYEGDISEMSVYESRVISYEKVLENGLSQLKISDNTTLTSATNLENHNNEKIQDQDDLNAKYETLKTSKNANDTESVFLDDISFPESKVQELKDDENIYVPNPQQVGIIFDGNGWMDNRPRLSTISEIDEDSVVSLVS